MFIPCKLQGFCLNIPASWCQEFFQASSWSWLRWYVWDPSKLHKAWDIPRGAKCFESPGTQGFPSPLGKEKKRQHKQQGVFCFPPSPLVRDQKKWTPRKFRMNQQLNHDHVKTFGDFLREVFPQNFGRFITGPRPPRPSCFLNPPPLPPGSSFGKGFWIHSSDVAVLILETIKKDVFS